ncbi:hypothetical protein LOD99_14617 [Oopsacas minuta]|uniref:Uncharacterized protein n=1 Tax=Oopsacas minuta TaxID=111878 RepID=A0AAV7KFQ5_9METZ|nr:hypothetical protein LOD99_14617 [Oopsacas minuta]
MEDFKDSFLIMSPYISSFFLPCNIQVLIQNWLHFLTNSSTIKRRVGASLLTSLVGNCKSSIHYTSLLLQLVLGMFASLFFLLLVHFILFLYLLAS